jgi:hypothetical protein
VVEDVGGGVEDEIERGVGALKIGDQNLDAALGEAVAKGADGEGEEFGAAIFAVVAIHAGEDGVAEAEGGGGFGDAAGLVVIDREGRAFLHGAEAAAAGADVAQNHESGGAAAPALADVGAGGALADGVEAQIAQERFQLAIVLAGGQALAQPGGTGHMRRDGDRH